MLIDGIKLAEGSSLENFAIASGTAYPGSPNTGELFYRSDFDTLFVYDGIAWAPVAPEATAAPVQSVFGRTGNVVLQTGDVTTALGFTPANAANLTKANVGLGNVDNTSDAAKPVSTAQQAALDLKAPLASPTFTGTVGGITKAMVGLGNVDNTTDLNKPVSTAQQNALNLKANLASPTFTGTVSGITKGMVGLGNVDNTTDLAKPVSTATQTALNLKSDITYVDSSIANLVDSSPATLNTLNELAAALGDDPNFATTTSTAIGNRVRYDAAQALTPEQITTAKTNIGLGNVDNTTDAAKPVSTATQTALDLKAPLASPTFTGTVSGITNAMVGLGNVENKSAATILNELSGQRIADALGYVPFAVAPSYSGYSSALTLEYAGASSQYGLTMHPAGGQTYAMVFLAPSSTHAAPVEHAAILQYTDSMDLSGMWKYKGYEILNTNNYKAYSTFDGIVAAGDGFTTKAYAVNARNPIWRFGNADNHGISYFQANAGQAGQDTIGFHFGTPTNAGSVLTVCMDGTARVGGNLIWHAGNDGALAKLNDATFGNLGVAAGTPVLRMQHVAGTSSAMYGWISYADKDNLERGWVGFGSGNTNLGVTNSIGDIILTANGQVKIGTGTAWHSDNDGAGSGLDADTLDGMQPAALPISTATQSALDLKTAAGTFPVGTSVASIDARSIVNPTTGLGYAAGMRVRFGHMNDVDPAAGYADVIDLSTYKDATGGGFNALYLNKQGQSILHKFAGAGATTWTTRTLAYTDSEFESLRINSYYPFLQLLDNDAGDSTTSMGRLEYSDGGFYLNRYDVGGGFYDTPLNTDGAGNVGVGRTLRVAETALASNVATAVMNHGTRSGATAFDWRHGGKHVVTANGNSSFSFINWPEDGYEGTIAVDFINFGSYTITPPTVYWINPNGTETTSLATHFTALAAAGGRSGFTAGGTTRGIFWTRNGGTTVYGRMF